MVLKVIFLSKFLLGLNMLIDFGVSLKYYWVFNENSRVECWELCKTPQKITQIPLFC